MAKPDLFAVMEQFKEAVASMEANVEVYIRANFVKAKLCRAYYLRLVQEGFSEKEALELCKHFNMEL